MDAVEAEEKARVVRLAEQDMADHFEAARGKAGLDVALEQGSAEAVMTTYVEKHWPDLVVAGTHGRSGVQPGVIGALLRAC